MAKTKDKVYDAAENVKPYVERAMNDEKLRDDVLSAFSTAKELYSELVGGRGAVTLATRVATDDEIRDWVARDGETALHPSCTARMGSDEDSVLDPLTMRVHGLDGLRVVDASAMPYVTNGNIYAPVMMIAEKAADLIRGKPAPEATVLKD